MKKRKIYMRVGPYPIGEVDLPGMGFANFGPARLSLFQRIKNHVGRIGVQLKRAAAIRPEVERE